MASFLIGLLIVTVTAVVMVGSLILVRKKSKGHFRVSSNEAAGATLQVAGTLYAVLLGLLTVHAMSEFDKARLSMETETGILDNLTVIVDVFPQKDQRNIQLIVYQYVISVLDKEWTLMSEHKVNKKAWDVSEELWNAIKKLDPQSEVQIASFGQMLSNLSDLNHSKRQRLLMSRNGVPLVLWLVLVLGGLALISYPFFYGLENTKAEACMIGLMSITLSLNLYLWVIYSDPYSGVKYVTPEAFKMLKTDLEYYFENEGIDFNSLPQTK